MNPNDNFLIKLFRGLSELFNGAETSFLDFLSVVVPYAVPVIPAYLTYFHTLKQMDFPGWVAWTAAFVVEVLGITAVSTAIRFWRNNQRYKDPKNQAPFKLAVGVYAFYILITMAVNVVLEIVSAERGGWVIFSIALFTLLSVPSGVLISIRTQYREMLDEKIARKMQIANAGNPAISQVPALQYSAETSQAVQNNGKRTNWQSVRKNLQHSDILFIAGGDISAIMQKYAIAKRTAYDWKERAKRELG